MAPGLSALEWQSAYTDIHCGSRQSRELLYLPDNSLAKKGKLKTALVTKNGVIDYDYGL